MASRAARHRFEPVSFVLGVIAVTAGLVVLAGGSLLDDATVLFPAGLIALGVAILLQVGSRREQPPGPVTVPSPPTGVAGQTLSGADLYDLLVPDPTEVFLAELAVRERSASPAGGEPPAVGPDPGSEPAEPSASLEPSERWRRRRRRSLQSRWSRRSLLSRPSRRRRPSRRSRPSLLSRPPTRPIGARARTTRTATPGPSGSGGAPLDRSSRELASNRAWTCTSIWLVSRCAQGHIR